MHMQRDLDTIAHFVETYPRAASCMGITVEAFVEHQRELGYRKSCGLKDPRRTERVTYPLKSVCTPQTREWLDAHKVAIIKRADELCLERAKDRTMSTLFEYFDERTKTNYYTHVRNGYLEAAACQWLSLSLRTGCPCADHHNCVAVQYQWCLLKAMREEALGPIDF